MPEYQGQFIEGAKGKLYLGCYGCWPAEKVIVLLPAFGEEMNLSRAVCTRQAYAFNSIGYSVVSLDYYGTGDSEGEFQDANADIWREDIRILLEWIGSQTQSKPILWGVRFGALLAASYLEQQGDECISGLIF
ncbi:MAG: alpha/beta hydrolase, partial [Motiliproteus sp.]|nr:alpha/beta hydrolase [Motiliproteus sp.]